MPAVGGTVGKIVGIVHRGRVKRGGQIEAAAVMQKGNDVLQFKFQRILTIFLKAMFSSTG